MSTPDERVRPFWLIHDNGDVLHGAQFPSGRVVVDSEHHLVNAATDIDHLSTGDGWRIEWPAEDHRGN